MASAALNEELHCSICLNIYTNPVTLSCGHNFCLDCINKTWTFQDKGEYSCPECRYRFRIRPELKKNLRLCNIVEHLHLAEQEKSKAEIFCNYCINTSVPAIKTCLHCEASLCERHVRMHSNSEVHVLSDPTNSWENRKCSVHREILKYYCTEDAVCICVSCSLAGEHRGHFVELSDVAYEKKKEKLRNVMDKLISQSAEIENTLCGLQDFRREIEEKEVGVIERVTALFWDIKEKLDVLENRVLSEISRQHEKIIFPVSDLIQQLEKEKNELSKKMHHIEELINMGDPLKVLQDQESQKAEKDGNHDTKKDAKTVTAGSNLDDILISLTIYGGLIDIVSDVKVMQGLYAPETSDILLDTSTVHDNIMISGDLKTVSWIEIKHQLLETPQRFEDYPRVLSDRCFTSGRHFWEVESSKSGNWSVGVCYPSVEKRGRQFILNHKNESWCLVKYNEDLSVLHDSLETLLHHKTICQRFGIFLNYEAGTVSFYQLCDPIRHLHTFTATFTKPLNVVICVYKSWVRISH